MLSENVTVEQELTILRRRLGRETAARREAESIAEHGLRALYQRQREISLLESIATTANGATNVDDAMLRALVEVCRHTGWPVGHLYYAPQNDVEKRGLMYSSRIWYTADQADYEKFREATLSLRFEVGVGLPGRIWQTGRPAWIENIHTDENYPRASVARSNSLMAAFGFPVLIGDEVVAVLEFYSRQTEAPDESILRIMAQVGTQLGRLLERKRARDKLVYSALHDPLTNLANRALCLQRINSMLKHARRVPNYLFAVLFLDLDRFKTVNDCLGHAAGDRLIVSVAQRLTACLRTRDLVSRDGSDTDEGPSEANVVARIGGDEFTIILDDVRNVSDPIRVAERIQKILAEPFQIDQQEVYTSASIGIALSASGYQDVNVMLRDADIAMYRAKEQGRAGWALFDQTMHDQVAHRLQMEADLRNAVARQEFYLCYQPIVAMNDGRINGFEALIRWQHPERGLIPPYQFIPLAEEIGLIGVIGEWVLSEACRQAKHWQNIFSQTPPLSISVNLSAKQLCNPKLVGDVGRILSDTDIAFGSLKLELTESLAMKDPEFTNQQLLDLKLLGVHISLDDFGTGYSSLSHLRRLPIDTLKVDRSFVSMMDTDKEKLQIAGVIVMLAHTMSMSVVAEGAETAAEVEKLKALKCDFVQGYYYYRPLMPDAAEAALKAQYALPAKDIEISPYCIGREL